MTNKDKKTPVRLKIEPNYRPPQHLYFDREGAQTQPIMTQKVNSKQPNLQSFPVSPGTTMSQVSSTQQNADEQKMIAEVLQREVISMQKFTNKGINANQNSSSNSMFSPTSTQITNSVDHGSHFLNKLATKSNKPETTAAISQLLSQNNMTS